MTHDELCGIFAKRYEKNSKEFFADTIIENDVFGVAMDIALGDEGSISFRAAYGVETAFFRAPDMFAGYYDRIAKDYVKITNQSVMRHYGKLMVWLLEKGKLNLSDTSANDIAEAAAIRLVDEEIKVAVKVWSIEILQHLSGRVNWINEQLPGILESISIAPSPAIVARLRKVKKKASR